ncbi:PAS domain S-box-containing protein [Granulicella aggregans]|uniref:histidine kinase n=1 Tax=Granulicella aggregans TaxID=474949 RepID=A0A7W7ZIL8_9BACT|nr:PAS domain S-box protein [Granulicella aggregans]MBB5060209.1 PAS domain S-box-containing protein [Granulicella aggregans]
MTESAFRRYLLRLALVPIVSLLVFVAILGVQLREISRVRTALTEATTILLQSDDVEKSMIDEETGIRGYLAANNSLFLQPYNQAAARLQSEFSTLQGLASSDSTFGAKVTRLAAGYKQFQDANQLLLKASISNGSNIDLMTQQKQAMDVLRAGLASIADDQTHIRQANRERLARIFGRLPVIVIGFGSLIGVLLLWYGNALYRQISSAFRRQLQETALQRDSLETTLQSIGDAVIVCDSAGKVTLMNPTAVKATGWLLGQAKGEPLDRIFRIINEHTREAVESPVAKVFREGKVVGLANHTLLVRRDGTEIPIDDSGAPIRDGSGEIAGVVLVFRDITERKQAEEELRQSNESRLRLAAIIDSADDAIISKDLNGMVTSWNEGASKLFGYSADEMIGQPILRVIPEELQYEETEILTTIRSGKQINHFETRREKKSGEAFEVSVTISPIRDESGTVIGASKIAREITDRKRVERLLVQSEKLAATGRMAATMAHEINNPLESLMNLIFLARHDSAPGGNVHDYLVTAEGELERLTLLARQTLGFYRDTGLPTEVSLNQLLESVISVYSPKLLAAGVTIEKHFDDQRKVLIRRGEFLQVFSNRITNAADAMRQGGALSISTHETVGPLGDGIETIIQDSGAGIQPEHLTQIFEPFFTTKGELGTGIGLWVAKQLVESRGGTISIASSTEHGNRGTTVTVAIPFAPPTRE